MCFTGITGTKVAHSKHVLKLIMCFNSYLVTDGTLTSILPSTGSGAIDLIRFSMLSVTELITFYGVKWCYRFNT